VKKVVVERLGVDASRVTDDASFGDDLAAESLDKIDLVMGFEEEFGCEINDAAASTILTIGDAVRFIEKQAATVFMRFPLRLSYSGSARQRLTDKHRQPDGNGCHQQPALELTELFRLLVVEIHMSATARPRGIRRNGSMW
jgi:acyl carrier protein